LEYNSNYIIGVIGELTFDKLHEVIGVSLLSPYSEIADEIINYIIRYSQKYTIESYIKFMGIQEHKISDELRCIVTNNMDLYYGKISTTDKLKPGAMALICLGINYKSDKLIFKKGSYK